MTTTFTAAIATAITIAIAAAASYPAQASKSPSTAHQPPQATGWLKTSSGTYEFAPTSCAIFKEDGFDDIEVGGPGIAPDGEKFYFEFSSTAGAIELQLGVDGPFKSSDRKLQAGRYISQEFAVTVNERTISVPSLVLVDENGQAVDSAAVLEIRCGG